MIAIKVFTGNVIEVPEATNKWIAENEHKITIISMSASECSNEENYSFSITLLYKKTGGI